MVGEGAKSAALARIAGGKQILLLPKHKVKIGNTTVHVRFRSSGKKGGTVWSFGINPNTLTADFELWICGSEGRYYLIPKGRIEEIYRSPDGRVDAAHPEIRVADIDSQSHLCDYRKGPGLDFRPYFLAQL